MRLFIALTALLVLTPTPSHAEDQAPPNAPPQWFTENVTFMTSGSGRWVADNGGYKSDQESWDAYGLEWVAGPGGYSMSGHLFGIKDGEDTDEDFWTFSQYWDPTTNRAVVQQYGWGSIGTGTMWTVGDDLWMQQTFSTFDAKSSEEGHLATHPDANSHVTSSYSIDATGQWSKNRTYTWVRDVADD